MQYHYDVRTTVLLTSLLFGCLTAPADQALDALAAVHQFREVAMSVDGSMVAWIETIPAKDGSDSSRSAVLVKDLRDAGAAARTVMDGGETVQGLTWSPDGKLAFVANTDSEKQLQL